jgi:hypothetical protein
MISIKGHEYQSAQSSYQPHDLTYQSFCKTHVSHGNNVLSSIAETNSRGLDAFTIHKATRSLLASVEIQTQPEGTQLGLQVLIHARQERFRKAIPIKYMLPTFYYASTQNFSSFQAIITSCRNMLHALSKNNHFKFPIELI